MVQHVVGADAVHALPETADSAATQLFVHDSFVSEVTACAAVFLGDVEAQQAGLTQPLPGLAVDVVLRPPAGIVRHHFGFDESRDCIAKCREVVVDPIGRVCHGLSRSESGMSLHDEPVQTVGLALRSDIPVTRR
jgi:hypothetical protein